MNKTEFISELEIGTYTAFVYDCERSRYQYVDGIISEEFFEGVDDDTEFEIRELAELPEVKEVILDNFIPDYPEYERETIKNDILDRGKIGSWKDGETTIYMLIW